MSGCGIASRTTSATARSASRSTPVFDPHLLEHVDQVFRGDIPGRIRGVRASPQTADGRVELGESRLHGRQDIGQGQIPVVVDVGEPLNLRIFVQQMRQVS